MSLKDVMKTIIIYLLIPVLLFLSLIVGKEDVDPFDEEDPMAMSYELGTTETK